VPQDPIVEAWRWLGLAAARTTEQGQGSRWKNLDDVLNAMAQEIPALKRAPEAAPESQFRMAGAKIPREPHRYSGRTAMVANVSVQEPKPPDDPDSPLSFSMEGNPNEPPGALIPFFWAPQWNSIQSVNKFQSEIGGPLKGGDPGVRLIEPAAGSSPPYFTAVPGVRPAPSGLWLAVPLYHIFGSDELSARSPAVRELAPKPYAALNAQEARSLGAEAGQLIRITADSTTFELPLQIAGGLPDGILGLPSGLPDFNAPSMPVPVSISRTL